MEKTPLSPEQLESALRDVVGEDDRAVIEAAKALSDDHSTTSRLVPLLATTRRPACRQGILYALSWHGAPDTWDLMVRILADVSEAPSVRGQAAEGIAYAVSQVDLASPEFERARDVLLAAVRDPSPEVRYCALFAIGASGHLPFIPLIEELTKDETPVPGWVGTVASKAREALEDLDGAHQMRTYGRVRYQK